MVHIGAFTRTADGYSGRLQTLTIDVELTLSLAIAHSGEKAPDFRIHRGASARGAEVGAAWKRTGENAGDYLSLLIDDPSFDQPIRAKLFRAEGDGSAFYLLWSRPKQRAERA